MSVWTKTSAARRPKI